MSAHLVGFCRLRGGDKYFPYHLVGLPCVTLPGFPDPFSACLRALSFVLVGLSTRLAFSAHFVDLPLIHLVGLCWTIAASRYGKMLPLPPCLFCCSLWWRWGKMCPLPPCHFFVFSLLVAVGTNVAPTTLSFFRCFYVWSPSGKVFLRPFSSLSKAILKVLRKQQKAF